MKAEKQLSVSLGKVAATCLELLAEGLGETETQIINQALKTEKLIQAELSQGNRIAILDSQGRVVKEILFR